MIIISSNDPSINQPRLIGDLWVVDSTAGPQNPLVPATSFSDFTILAWQSFPAGNLTSSTPLATAGWQLLYDPGSIPMLQQHVATSLRYRVMTSIPQNAVLDDVVIEHTSTDFAIMKYDGQYWLDWYRTPIAKKQAAIQQNSSAGWQMAGAGQIVSNHIGVTHMPSNITNGTIASSAASNPYAPYTPKLTLHPGTKSEIFTVHDNTGVAIVTFHDDGSFTFGPNYQPDVAAQIFWGAIADYSPHGLASQLDQLNKQIAMAKGQLNVLSQSNPAPTTSSSDDAWNRAMKIIV